jgi:hypothetical protein
MTSALVLLAACGGSTATPSSGPTASSSSYPTGTTNTSRAHAGPARDVVHRSGQVAVAHGHDSEPEGKPNTVNPCSLMTTQEVAAIIGQPVEKAAVTALGPTCVYIPGKVSASHRGGQVHPIEVTLAVTPLIFKTSTARLKNAVAFKVGGHTADCGVVGHPVAYVSLSHGRVMTITAPCPIAAQIARSALPRLPGS